MVRVRGPFNCRLPVVAAVLTELFIFCTTHGNVEIFITVCTCFVQSFFCPLSLLSQLALSPATWVEGRALVRWRRWRRGSKRGGWIYALFHGIIVEAELLSAGVQERGGREAHRALQLLPQPIRCWCEWGHFLVRLSSVDLQTIFRFERISV